MRTTALILVLSLSVLSSARGRADSEVDADAATRSFIAKTCAGCHPGPQLDAMVGRRLARGPLADFLATHHVPDPDQRAAVSAYLERGAEAPAP